LARPKAFNQDFVLTEAMLCFWRRGYSATSMKNLEAATGLTPGSIYNSFGSKDGLFLSSLDHYIEKVVKRRVQKYLLEGDPIAGIEAYFYDGFHQEKGAVRDGCLLINTSTELGPHDEVVRKQVIKGMKVAQNGLEKALDRAKQSGQIDQSVDSKLRARHLGLVLNGMLVQTKISAGQQWLDGAMVNVRSLLQ
jgi:TetR/AcrR family transcriptional regulator, transcriptional repressor for nem operon